MSARNEDKLRAVADEIKSAGGEAVVVVGDVSKVQTPSTIDSGEIQNWPNSTSGCIVLIVAV